MLTAREIGKQRDDDGGEVHIAKEELNDGDNFQVLEKYSKPT